jgi:hypothetical protein
MLQNSPPTSTSSTPSPAGLSEFIDKPLERVSAGRPAPVVLAEVLKSIRPELDLYFVANLGTDDDQVDDVPQVSLL